VLAGIPDGVWRETVKDFLVGRSFRRDIFVRAPVRLTPAEKTEGLDRALWLTVPRAAATAGIRTAMGEVKGRADLYAPILDRLAAGPIRAAQLLADLTGPERSAAAVLQAVRLLIHSGQVKMVRAHQARLGAGAVVHLPSLQVGRCVRTMLGFASPLLVAICGSLKNVSEAVNVSPSPLDPPTSRGEPPCAIFSSWSHLLTYFCTVWIGSHQKLPSWDKDGLVCNLSTQHSDRTHDPLQDNGSG
jgi:hypothetical protein